MKSRLQIQESDFKLRFQIIILNAIYYSNICGKMLKLFEST